MHSRRRWFHATALGVVFPALLGAQVQRAVRADTVIVRTAGQGLWRTPQVAVRQLRLTGTAAGEFTRLGPLVALPNGGVAVVESELPDGRAAILVIDRTGKLLHRIGRDGSGPGEFQPRTVALALLATPTGDLLLVDDANARLTRWNREGTLLGTTSLGFPIHAFPPTLAYAPRGGVYVRGRLVPHRPGGGVIDPGTSGFVRIDADGTATDTLRGRPEWVGPPAGGALDPMTTWMPMPDGRVLVVRTDRLRIILASVDGATPLLAEQARAPIRTSPAEFDWMRALARIQGFPRGQLPELLRLPSVKPVVRAAGIQIEHSGRIWLPLHGTGTIGRTSRRPIRGQRRDSVTVPETHEPIEFAVFEGDGRFDGYMSFPLLADEWNGVQRVTVAQDVAWGVVQDRDGAPLLVQWRLPAGRESARP